MSTRVITSYYDSGEKASEHEEANGILSGHVRRWHQNGQLFVEAEYKDGLAHGVSQQWTESGIQTLFCIRKKGSLHGKYQSWWDDGIPKEEGIFLDGVRQPGYRWYKTDGTLWKELQTES